jgi:transforming growth factor-beta-induced protein
MILALRSTALVCTVSVLGVVASLAACGDDETVAAAPASSTASGGGAGGNGDGGAGAGEMVTSSASSGGAGGGGGALGTVYEVASALPDYSTLVAAVDKAGMAAQLQDPFADLTVFAPDNDAFAALLSTVGAASLDDLSVAQLAPILRYHVLGSRVDGIAANFAAENGEALLGMGGRIRFSLSRTSTQLDGTAVIETADVAASNGIIHGIDAVILPSVTDVVTSDDAFSSLETALGMADADPSAPKLIPTLDDDDATLTVFAPSNAAFAALVSTLGASSSTGIAALSDFKGHQLIPVLKYHVVTGSALRAADVTAGALATLGGSASASTGSGVTVDGSAVTTADIFTSNGVLHVLDGVMLPSITDVVTTAPEFTRLALAIAVADSDGATTPKIGPTLDAAAANGSYTLFAPDDAAFAALGTPPSGQQMTDLLRYHVLDEATPIYASDALALSSVTPFDTLLGTTANEQIGVSASAGAVVLDDAGTATNATVTVADYFTANGVIHTIDKVLFHN